MKHDFEKGLQAMEEWGKDLASVQFPALAEIEIARQYDVICYALKLAQKLELPASEEMLDGKARAALLEYSCNREITKAKAIDNIWKAMVEQAKREIE